MTPAIQIEVDWFKNSLNNWQDTSKATDAAWIARFKSLSAEAINEITINYGLNGSYQALLTVSQVNELSQKTIKLIVTTLRDSLTLADKHALTASTLTRMFIGLNAKPSWALDGANSWLWQITKEQVQQLSVQGGVALYKLWTNNNKVHPNYGDKNDQQQFKDQTFVDQFRALSSEVMNDLIEYENGLPAKYQALLSVDQINNLSQLAINATYANWKGFLSNADAQNLTPNTVMKMLSSLNEKSLSLYDNSNQWVRQLTEEQVSQLDVSGGLALYSALVKDITANSIDFMTAENKALFVKLIQWINPDTVSEMMVKQSLLSVVLNHFTADQLYGCSSDAFLKQLLALNATTSWAGDGQNSWIWKIREAQVSQLSNECSTELFKALTNKYTDDVYGQNKEGKNYKDEIVAAQFRSLNGHVINALILEDKLAVNFAGLLTTSQIHQLTTKSITTQLKKLNKVSWVGGLHAVGTWVWNLTDAQVSKLGVEGGVALYKAWTQANKNLLYVQSKTSGNFTYQTAISQFRALSGDVISALIANKFDVDLRYDYQRLITIKQLNGLSQEDIKTIYPTLRSSIAKEEVSQLSISTLTSMLFALNDLPESWAGDGKNGWLWYITDTQVKQLGVEAGFQLYKAWTNNNNDFGYGDNIGGKQYENRRVSDQFRALNADVINAIIDKRFGYGMHWAYQRLLMADQLNGLSKEIINAIYPTLRSQSDINAEVPKLSISTLSNMLFALNDLPESWAGDGKNGWLLYMTDAQVSQLGVEAGFQLYKAWTNNNTDFGYGDNIGGTRYENKRVSEQFRALNADVINAIIDKRFGYGMHWAYQRLLMADQLNGLSKESINAIYPTLRSQSDRNAEVPKLSTSTLSNMLFALNAIPESWAGDGKNGWLWYMTDAQVSQLGVEAGFQLYKAWTNNNTDFGYGDNIGGTRYENKRVSEQFRSLNADVINAIIDKRFGYGMHWAYQRLLTTNKLKGLSKESIDAIYPTLPSQSDSNAVIPTLSISTLSDMLFALNNTPESWAGDGKNGWLWYITDAQVKQLGVEAGFQLYKAWTNNNTDFGYGDNIGGKQYENRRVSDQFRALNADVINAIIDKRFGYGMHWAYQRLLMANQLNGLSKESINAIYPILRSQSDRNAEVPKLSINTLSNMLFALNAIPESWAGDGQNGWLWYITDAQVSQLGVEAGLQLYKAWTNNNTDFGYGDNQYKDTRVPQQFRALNADVINAIIDKRFGYGLDCSYQRLLTVNQVNGLSTENINLIYPTLRSQLDINTVIPNLSTSTLSNMLFALNAIRGSWAGEGQNGWLWYMTDEQVRQLGVDAGLQLYKAWTNNNTDFRYGDNVGGEQLENTIIRQQFRALNADVINAIIDKRFGYGMHWAYQRLLTTNQLNGLSKESINAIYPTLRSQSDRNADIPTLSISALSNMLFALNDTPESWAGDGKNGWLWYITDTQVKQLGVEAGFQLYKAWTHNNNDFGYGDNIGGKQYENRRVSDQFRALNADVLNAIIDKRFGYGMHWAYQRLLTVSQLNGLSKESINLIYPTLRSQSDINTVIPKLSINTLSNMLFALNAIPGSWAGEGQNGWLWYMTDAQVSQLGVEAGFQLYKAWTNNNTDFGYGDNIGGKQYENQRVSDQFRALNTDVINAIIDKRFGYGMHLSYQRLLTTSQLNGLSGESINLIYPKIRNSLTYSDIESLSASTIDKLINAMNNDPIRKDLLREDTWIWNITPAKISQLSTNESAILFEQWYSKLGSTKFIKKISKNSQGVFNDPTLVSQIRALSAASIIKVNRYYMGERLKALSVNQIEALGLYIGYAGYFVAQYLSIDELQSLSLDAINYILRSCVLYNDKSWVSDFADKLKDNQLDKCDLTSSVFNEWADNQSPDRLAKIGALTRNLTRTDIFEEVEIDFQYHDTEQGIKFIMQGNLSGVSFFKYLMSQMTTKLGSVQLLADYFIEKDLTLPSNLRLMRVQHINAFSPELFKLLNAQSRLGFLELTGGQITAMDDEHTKIYVHYLNNNWSTDYYSTTIIEKLSPIGFVNLDFTRISPDTIRALNKEKVAAITGAQFVVMRLEQLSQFSPLQVSWISNATIQDMGVVICKLTPDQLRGITHSQATYVNKTQWLRFQVEQKGILATNVGGSLNANVLNSFTDEEVNVLTPQQFTWISLNTIKKLSVDLIKKLSPKQIWAMSPEQMSALGPEKARLFNVLTFQGMGKLQWEALNKSPGSGEYPSPPIFAMTKAQLQNIRLENLSLIPPSSIALLTDENLRALTSQQCLALTMRQYMALSENQKSCLTTKPIAITAGNQIANISPEKLALLPAETIQTLNIIQFRSLSTSQVQSLTNDQMQSLLGLMLNGLTAEDIQRFSRLQMDAINVSQLLEVNEVTQNLILSRMSESASTIASRQIANQKAVLGKYDPVARAYKTPLVSSTAFRNLYSTATASRTFAAFKYNMTTFKVEVDAREADNARLQKADFFKDFKATMDATRSRQQGLRMISTLWSLFGVASAFSRAATYDQRNGINVSSNVVQGLAWLASALQVPWTMLYSAFSEAAKAERLLLDRNPAALQDEIRSVRNVAWEQSFQKDMGGKTIVTDYVNRIAGVPATNSEAEIRPVSSEHFALSNDSYRAVNGDIVRVEPAPKIAVYSDTLSFSDFKNMELLTGDRIWANFKAGGGVFLAANIMNVINYSYNIRDTRFDNNLKEKEDVRTARLVMQSLGLVGALSLLTADMIGMLAVDSAAAVATAGAARASAAFGMAGFGLIVASSASLTIYNDVKNFQKDSTDGAKVALALDVAGTFFQLALLVGCLVSGGPVGAAVMVVMALIPNWGSVGSAIDLANKQRELDSQGRYAEGDIICYHLHQIAALNATPIVNLGSGIYTPIIMEQIYTKMTNGGFLQALQENYSYYISNDNEGNPGRKVVNEIMGNMKTAFNYRVDTDPYLTNMRYINVDFASPKDYYANGPEKSFYWSMLDVQCDQNGELKAVTDLQWIASTVFINDRAKNSTEVISIASANTTEEVITVDARGSTQDMIFYVMLDACIVYGGSGKNSYIINADNLVSTGYQIYGTGNGTTINDTVQYIGKINTAQINLDNINNAYVKGTEYQNNVWATKSEKSYQYAGGIDTVKLLGGKSSASIGGRGNYLRMAGGNNTAYAVLGFTMQSNLADGFYDGGSTTPTKDATGKIVGLNTLNFSGSCLALQISVVDPNSSTYSSAATLHDKFNDIARFTNFHNLVGTSFGDNIKIENTTNIDQVFLGEGNNDVIVNNSIGVSIISGDSYQNKIYLNNSDVAVASNTGSVEVNVGPKTKLYSILNGVSDVINAQYADNYFVYNGLMESGSHTIHLNQGTASITVLPDVENSTTFVYEESTQRDSGHLLNLTLGEKFDDALFRMGNDGVYFLGKDNRTQELNYFVDEATTLYNTNDSQAADITKYVSISSSSLNDSVITLNLLIQAAASMSRATSATTTHNGNTYFKLSDVATVVQNQYSPIT